MLVTATLAFLAVLSTVVGVWDKITSSIRKTIILGSILVATSLLTQVVQVVQKREQESQTLAQEAEIAKQQKIIDDRNKFIASNLTIVDEASGGAVSGNLAYVVDDDNPSLFVFEYAEAESKYKLLPQDPVKIIDARPCSVRLDWEEKCNDSTPTELTNKLIEDLEGAAIYNNKLYLTTSQSLPNGQSESTPGARNEEPRRWLFLEVTPTGQVIRATRKIRPAILEAIKNGNGVVASNKLEEVQVEGLVIDKNGFAYLGLRSPLIRGHALVLRATVEQLFSEKPTFDAFLLDLEFRDKQYGITSLDYDPKLDQILVLGNSPARTKTLPVVIWAWTVNESIPVQRPLRYDGEIFTVFDAPGTRPAKPEIILFRQENRIHLFFDAEGSGLQVSLLRDGTRLVSTDPPHRTD